MLKAAEWWTLCFNTFMRVVFLKFQCMDDVTFAYYDFKGIVKVTTGALN